MKVQIIFSLFVGSFCLATNVASAASGINSFSGVWSGPGQAIMSPGDSSEKQRACSEIAIHLEQKPQSIELRAGHYLCQDLQAEYSAASFSIDGSDLIWNGKKVGTIYPHEIQITYVDPADNVTFKLSWSLGQENLDYKEQWIDGQGRLRLLVSGQLKNILPAK